MSRHKISLSRRHALIGGAVTTAALVLADTWLPSGLRPQQQSSLIIYAPENTSSRDYASKQSQALRHNHLSVTVITVQEFIYRTYHDYGMLSGKYATARLPGGSAFVINRLIHINGGASKNTSEQINTYAWSL